MVRRRSQPWIYRYSRVILGAIAVVGILITGYLTISALAGKLPACPTQQVFGLAGCDTVLSSKYAKLFGLPLSLFGMLAYVAMAGFALSPYLISPETNKQLRGQVEEWTWKFLSIGSTSMVVFSGYLIAISLLVLHAECIYCLGSAACSIGLFIVTIMGRYWEEIGQLFFTIVIVGMVTLVGSLGLYAMAKDGGNVIGDRVVIPEATTAAQPPKGWDVTTESTPAEIALAEHLTKVGAKMYGAFWCPHCYEQKQLLGKEAMEKITYVECDPAGVNPQRDQCVAAKIEGFPTWEIAGKSYPGTQSLETLAKLSGYTGSTNFKYTLPQR